MNLIKLCRRKTEVIKSNMKSKKDKKKSKKKGGY